MDLKNLGTEVGILSAGYMPKLVLRKRRDRRGCGRGLSTNVFTPRSEEYFSIAEF